MKKTISYFAEDMTSVKADNFLENVKN